MLKTAENCNYIEIVFFNKKYNEFVFDIDHSTSRCQFILSKLSQLYPDNKTFKKHYTKYLYDTLELTKSNADNMISVHNLELLDHTSYKDSVLVNYYDKQILPTHRFPSTTSLKDIIDCKKVVMKIKNNIYFNFDSLEYSDKTICNHMYININYNKSTDFELINNIVHELMSKLEEASTF